MNGSGKEKVDDYMYGSISLPILRVRDTGIRLGRTWDLGWDEKNFLCIEALKLRA